MKGVYVVIPSLNPDNKLNETVKGLKDAGFEKFIIVDDGSDAQHKKFFPETSKDCIRLVHRKNRGKGRSLKFAFRYILCNCPDAECVVTVDGDGQHLPEDVLRCVSAVDTNKNTAVFGCRNFKSKKIPARSRFGNNFTHGVLKLLCGINISDSQTGLRAFPVSLLPLLLKIKGERYEYETNMLLKFKQNGVEFKEVKIHTVYIEENESSHFKPFVDSLRIYRFILAFFATSIASFVIDIVLFHLLKAVFSSKTSLAILLATVLARVVSSLINYSLNKTKVFDCKSGKNTLLKYYLLAIPQMLVSALLVTAFTFIFGLKVNSFSSTLVKLIIDTVLFFISYRIQQNFVFSEKHKKKRKEEMKQEKLTGKTIFGRIMLCFATFLGAIVITVVSVCLIICYGPSKSIRNMLVISAEQASATKWAPYLFMSKSAVEKIMNDSKKVNADTVSVDEVGKEENKNEFENCPDGVKLDFVQKPNFKAYIMLVPDAARIKCGVSSDNFASAVRGKNIFDIVDKYNAVAAINGGEFLDAGGQGSGAKPMGITYSYGSCVWSDTLVRTFIGFNNENKLVCKEGMTKAEAEKLGIRDGLSFQNGNVLIEQDGENVKLNYSDNNTGTSQRTAIGQRKDGTVILLVTDGRSAESIGATKNDVIDLLVSYGAVNAGMLDGGSSSMLYYKDYISKYNVDTSKLDSYQKSGLVNRYKAFTSPRMIPSFFIVLPEGQK